MLVTMSLPVKPVKLELLAAAAAPSARPTALGLVVPFDFVLDDECRRWLPARVALHTTRTPRLSDTAVTVELAKSVGDQQVVASAVQALLATQAGAIGYACTSGSFVDGLAGERELQQAMLTAGAAAAVTTSGALVQALAHLGVQRLAIATPYNLELTQLLADFLTEANFTVVSSGFLDREEGIARVGYDQVRRLAELVDHPEAEAIFFSCTNLHSFDIIEELERQLGKPVLSANQVTMWAALTQAGLPAPELPQALFAAVAA
jgi:maleate isomerase